VLGNSLPRLIADKLSAKWGQPVVVENPSVAALNIGAEAVARAEGDSKSASNFDPSRCRRKALQVIFWKWAGLRLDADQILQNLQF
jgi:hypothetical protein